MKGRFMSRKLIGLLFFFGLFLNLQCFAQGNSFEQQQLERMTQEYGEVSYTAWLSVMHGLSNGLSSDMSGLYDETQFPFELAQSYTSTQKEQLKKEIVDYLHMQGSGKRELLFHRVEMWLLAWQQWNICEKLKSIEETVSVLYEMEPDQSMFQYVRKNRGFKKGAISAAEIASSMSSAEVSGLEYELLDDWSALSREEILGMFSQMLSKLSNKEGVK